MSQKWKILFTEKEFQEIQALRNLEEESRKFLSGAQSTSCRLLVGTVDELKQLQGDIAEAANRAQDLSIQKDLDDYVWKIGLLLPEGNLENQIVQQHQATPPDVYTDQISSTLNESLSRKNC